MSGRRLINEKCPSCRNGHLRPVFMQDGTVRKILERLGCSRCGASYESEHRGKTIEEILFKKACDFVNPKRKPKDCRECGSTHVDTFTFVPTQVGRLRLVNTQAFEEVLQRTATRCLICCSILWVSPSRLDIQMKKQKNVPRDVLARRIVGIPEPKPDARRRASR